MRTMMILFIGSWAAALSAPLRSGAPDLELGRSGVSSGTAFSMGGDFELAATIGQSATGVAGGGPFTLTAGFWVKLAPGDCDSDGLVSLFDYESFSGCLVGPAGPEPSVECACQDSDRTNAVDLRDYATLLASFSRP